VTRQVIYVEPPPPRDKVPFKDVSLRKYPRALKPSHVFRADGSHMTWERWLASPTLEMSGILFEDGHRVGLVQPTA
jgi:hypothetical protein